MTAEAQILQTPGYVVMISQSNQDVRIIPLDGRPHLPKTVGQWLGDARGRWEGTTLVVETTNFNQRNWRGSNEGMHLVERFTLVGPKTLRYQFTVTDPTTWTRPWSIDSVLPKIDPPIYEFACHEVNYGLINWATGTQIRKKKRHKAVKSRSPRVKSAERNDMRTRMTLVGAVVAVGLLLVTAPVRAHHAFAAAFDENKPINLQGRSQKWSWSIPTPGSGWT